MKINLKKKTNKYIFFSSFVIIITIIGISAYSLSPLSPFDVEEGNIYITAGDVMRNFKLDTFDDMLIDSGGSVQGLDNRLKFEVGAQWTANPNDAVIQYAELVGDTVFVYYKITFKNKINIYTNSRLSDVVLDKTGIDGETTSYLAGSYTHRDFFNHPLIDWDSYIYWNHLEVGNVRSYNAEHNLFSGNLELTFDIDDSPLPDTITDSNGNTANKSFDYISVSSAYVSETIHGMLSDEVPTVVSITPAEYDTKISSTSGGGLGGDVSGYDNVDSVAVKYTPNPIPGEVYVSDTFDFGTQTQSDGSSLNPTQKDGSDIFDSRVAEESMGDCRLTYNIGSLSPLIKTYSQTLHYTTRNYETKEYWVFWPFTVGIQTTSDTTSLLSVTEPVALHVTNRYVQPELAVTFNVWTSYNIIISESDTPELDLPSEYYDELVFDSVVDGFGGGTQYTEPTQGLFGGIFDFFNSIEGIIVLIIIVAIVGIIIYIAFKFVGKKKSTGAGITIITKK